MWSITTDSSSIAATSNGSWILYVSCGQTGTSEFKQSCTHGDKHWPCVNRRDTHCECIYCSYIIDMWNHVASAWNAHMRFFGYSDCEFLNWENFCQS